MQFKEWVLRETTEQDFIRAIHINPHDQQLWLVYADWLDDQGDTQRAELIRRAKVKPITWAGQASHMGERQYQTLGSWRKAIQAMFPGATFEGDKDIAQAKFQGMGVGEWDGETGTIYTKFVPPK